MEQRYDMPPTRTVKIMDSPPENPDPTTAQLKADINSGKTGDKIGVFDPALSPLGTDEEAAGTPAGPARIRMARHFEGIRRWAQGTRPGGYAHIATDRAAFAYFAGSALIACLLIGGIVLVRA